MPWAGIHFDTVAPHPQRTKDLKAHESATDRPIFVARPAGMNGQGHADSRVTQQIAS
ncbi:hypothetical protein GCM10010532_033270 [Dactylosporangium siamense]|uniref:Uncharacterized protein n=1 Tax=Dactylosporangium siamense TaxID=685454 RepID=A0A919UAK1_9ACTN|nr:hypothetical protein Dsi01nite_017640 [Dactylosporangium siamense]